MNRLVIRFCDFIFGKHKSKTLPRKWILAADMAMVILAFVVAMFMLYVRNFKDSLFDWTRIWLVPIAYLVAFLLSRTYDGMLRYSGFNDIRKIFSACTSTLVVLIVSKFIIGHFWPMLATAIYPRYVTMVYHYLITMVLMIMMRFTIRRLYNEIYKNTADKMNVLIYGAGDGGTMLFRTISQDTTSRFRVKAFVDDDPKRIKSQINTIKVFSPKEALTPEFIEKYDIDVMIVAIPSLNETRKKEIIEKGLALNLIVKSIPSFEIWVDGKMTANQIEDIKIEEVLGRRPIVVGKANIAQEIKDKVVLVTGAAGSIGSEICRQAMRYNPAKLVIIDQAESALSDFQFEVSNTPEMKEMLDKMVFIVANTNDAQRMREVFKTYRPQVVFHAAAFKNVAFMEENVYEAVLVNVFGTKLVADLAMEFGTEKFVMISSDKAINPTSVMGTTKRIAEMYTQSRKGNTKFITARFGDVLDSNGSVVPLFRKQIEKGGPITVTDRRITRYFITLPEAGNFVLESGALGNGGDTFVFDMGEKVRIWELAEKMRKLTHQPDLEIVETGLRPGEKLYEELLADDEKTQKTESERIMRVLGRKYETDNVDAMVEKLHAELETGDPMKIVAQMKAMVPEYKSNNSIFSKLDK